MAGHVEYGSCLSCWPGTLLRGKEDDSQVLGYSTWLAMWNMGEAYLAGLILFYGVKKGILKF
jgi:hypothetical protein